MSRSPLPTDRPTGRRRRILLALVAALLVLLPLALPAAAAEEAPTLEARVMLDGHARLGSWIAIEVRIRNQGPSVTGELMMTGGAQARTRFSTPVDSPTDSNKVWHLYAQPPAFGGQLDIALVSGGRTIARTTAAYRLHDASQLVVGVIAETPQGIVGDLDLLPNAQGSAPAIVPLSPDDLPWRVEAWAPLDRLVWQDVESTDLRPEQLAAMRGWLAGGGRLILAGGTAGPSVLSAFPDDILPFRPEVTIDAPPDALTGLAGTLPGVATDLPALAGELRRGDALATVGDRAIAADARYGGGSVTVIGFDPTSGWVSESGVARSLWRRLLPPRTSVVLGQGDDSQLVSAVSQLPALALPPIGGMLALLGGYIALIGPVNYLVLRRLDRREWAWVTMPLLIVVFAAGSYGYGAALRGLDVIVNEVAIVRGAPGATEGTAQVYLGIFSPSRGTYQVDVPNGALLTSTVAGEFVGNDPGALDIVQGEPSRVRDLVVGFGSLRTVRAETAAVVPRVTANIRLEGGTLKGTVRNDSDEILEKPAIVLGGSVLVMADLEPGEQQTVSLPIRHNPFGQNLAEQLLGVAFYGDPARTDDKVRRTLVRQSMVNHLTWDPNGVSGRLPSEGPVLLAWGTNQVVDVRIQGQVPRRTGNVLYYLPLSMEVSGTTAFHSDLIQSSLVETDAAFFSKDPYSIYVGEGSATFAYRPIGFDGSITATKLVLGMNFGGDTNIGGEPRPIVPEPTPSPGPSATPEPEPSCDPNTGECFGFRQVPEVEVFDRRGEGSWVRLPDFEMGRLYELADPERYVDPATGAVLVRFVNDGPEQIGFTFQVRIEGDVR